jgi:SAM-dependent methyltransferase
LGVSFELPPGDPRLLELHDGGPAPTPPLDNLVGAVTYWHEHPDWMEFLDPSSPSYHDKMVERALYLDFWHDHLPAPGSRVLDVGGGVGRFMAWLLEQSCSVELVDPDLRSLWRAVSYAAGKPGFLDVHWTTGECLPALEPVDCVVAVEVLCYVEDPVRVLRNLAQVMKPGAPLLLSVEARWGWAMGADVHEGSIADFFGDGIVHVPGDRWVRTFEQDDLLDLLEEAGFELVALQPSHYALSGPFEMAAGELTVEEALLLEERLRAHPVSRGLNRAWMAVARART